MRKTLLISLVVLSCISHVYASGDEKKYTRHDYIERWKVTALKNMFEYGIPASITLAQGILESGNGNSTLTRKANNHFGIKCHGWDGPGYYMDDDRKDECFRVYKYAEDSFEDHSQFLLKKRYADLFKLKTTDYKGWAKGLKKAGYATHPEYAKRLIKIIEDSKLYKYDNYTFGEFTALKSKSKYAQEEDPIEIVDTAPKKKYSGSKGSSDKEIVYGIGRKVYVHENNIQYVIAEKNDSFDKIAKDMNLGRWQILKYNDLEKNDKISDGEVIFIQPKHSKSKRKTHSAVKGDTYWSISQEYGIKLKKLLKKNNAQEGQSIKAGQKINLR